MHVDFFFIVPFIYRFQCSFQLLEESFSRQMGLTLNLEGGKICGRFNLFWTDFTLADKAIY